jgi:FkbM family methyltransferase
VAVREIVKGDVRFAVDDGDQGRYAEFWDWYESPTWEPDTLTVYRACVGPGSHVLDVGAWIGPTTLLAAGLGATVVAVEPDPVAAERLKANLALNPELAERVSLLELAVAVTDGEVELESEQTGGDSLSHLRLTSRGGATTWTVQAATMPSLLALHETGRPTFLKLDAEGAEYAAIPAAREYIARHRPALYLSTHPNLLYDRTSLGRRIGSALATFRANRRLVRALMPYAHHYAERDGVLVDIRARNRLRAWLPLPVRPLLLVGSCLFTDAPIKP